MGLDGEQHHILWPGLGHPLHGAHSAGVLFAAVFEDQPEAIGLDRRQVLVAGDEGDLLTGQRQLGAQIAADGTGANDRELHAPGPCPSPSFCAKPMRCSLPVAPLGISSMNRIFFGTL